MLSLCTRHSRSAKKRRTTSHSLPSPIHPCSAMEISRFRGACAKCRWLFLLSERRTSQTSLLRIVHRHRYQPRLLQGMRRRHQLGGAHCQRASPCRDAYRGSVDAPIRCRQSLPVTHPRRLMPLLPLPPLPPPPSPRPHPSLCTHTVEAPRTCTATRFSCSDEIHLYGAATFKNRS